jgi:hypothetical protein
MLNLFSDSIDGTTHSATMRTLAVAATKM